MSEFSGIDGFEGWKDKLNELLQAAKAAAANQDLPQRIAISERLTDFTIASFPNTPEIKELDRIAGEAAAGILRQSIEERLADLARQTVDVARLAKQFNSIGEANEAKAESIRLKHGQQVIDTVTETVKAINQFRDTLDSKDDKKLLEEVNAVVGSLQKLRKTVEDKG